MRPILLVVNAGQPITSIADLKKHVAAHKGKFLGSWGIGTISHLSASRHRHGGRRT